MLLGSPPTTSGAFWSCPNGQWVDLQNSHDQWEAFACRHVGMVSWIPERLGKCSREKGDLMEEETGVKEVKMEEPSWATLSQRRGLCLLGWLGVGRWVWAESSWLPASSSTLHM